VVVLFWLFCMKLTCFVVFLFSCHTFDVELVSLLSVSLVCMSRNV
jgi:hypothetical protein